MTGQLDLYQFVFRGLLAEEALDLAGRNSRDSAGLLDESLARRLSIDLLDDQLVAAAQRMATVYTAIAAFENTVRELLTRTLIDEYGDDWWDQAVSSEVRKRAENRQEDEGRNRYHGRRGDAPMNYTDLKDLISVVRNNWPLLEPFLQTQDWAKNILDMVERSRNVIMHSGSLDPVDIERVGMNIRDWVKQVGA